MYDIAGGAQVAINELSDAGKDLTDMRSALVFSAMPPGTVSLQPQSAPRPAMDFEVKTLNDFGGSDFGGGGLHPSSGGFGGGFASQSSFGEFGGTTGHSSFGKFGGFGSSASAQFFGGGHSSNGGFGGGQSSNGEFRGGGFGGGW
jgi:hypothetical protein